MLKNILTGDIKYEKGEFDVIKEIPRENLTSDNKDVMSNRNL